MGDCKFNKEELEVISYSLKVMKIFHRAAVQPLFYQDLTLDEVSSEINRIRGKVKKLINNN